MKDQNIDDSGVSALDMTFGDFLAFTNWMDQTEKALDLAEPLPPTPNLFSAKVRGWIQAIHRLEERARQAEEHKLVAEANTLAQEVKLAQLLSHLHVHMAALYEHLGQAKKAAELRHKADTLHYL